MCPDPQMLSLYHDGELPPPWEQKLESHLSLCAGCRGRLERLRRLSGILGDPVDPSAEPARERVWQRLNSAMAGGLAEGGSGRTWPQPFWNRSVRVPLPLLAAAAALALVFAVFLVRNPRTAAPANSALTALDMQTVVPVTDMNGVLQYLGNDDLADIVIIRLPESRSFSSYGEPAIIRAADYGGGR